MGLNMDQNSKISVVMTLGEWQAQLALLQAASALAQANLTKAVEKGFLEEQEKDQKSSE